MAIIPYTPLAFDIEPINYFNWLQNEMILNIFVEIVEENNRSKLSLSLVDRRFYTLCTAPLLNKLIARNHGLHILCRRGNEPSLHHSLSKLLNRFARVQYSSDQMREFNIKQLCERAKLKDLSSQEGLHHTFFNMITPLSPEELKEKQQRTDLVQYTDFELQAFQIKLLWHSLKAGFRPDTTTLHAVLKRKLSFEGVQLLVEHGIEEHSTDSTHWKEIALAAALEHRYTDEQIDYLLGSKVVLIRNEDPNETSFSMITERKSSFDYALNSNCLVSTLTLLRNHGARPGSLAQLCFFYSLLEGKTSQHSKLNFLKTFSELANLSEFTQFTKSTLISLGLPKDMTNWVDSLILVDKYDPDFIRILVETGLMPSADILSKIEEKYPDDPEYKKLIESILQEAKNSAIT